MNPLILVCNDDGITSQGIKKLVEIAKTFGEVVVVAPDSPQSGMGHAITVGEPLRFRKSHIFSGVEAYECSGTPADCVKMAKSLILKDRKIDLIVSGINHGTNSAINVLYSGTMSAAIEGAIEGYPSIGFSFCNYDPNVEMSYIDKFVKIIIKQAFERGIPPNTALNVNFPDIQPHKIKGIKVCRQANATWEELFSERKDPNGKDYFWLAGNFVTKDDSIEHDEWALANNYIAIVPCHYDLTKYDALKQMNETWKFESINLKF